MVFVWRIGANVGKVEIQRNQGPRFVAADAGHIGVRLTDHLLVVNGCRLVSGGVQQLRCFDGQILVDLESHLGRSTGQWYNAFTS